jgi:hypothetical protein
MYNVTTGYDGRRWRQTCCKRCLTAGSWSLLLLLRFTTGFQPAVFKEGDRFLLITGFAIDLYCLGKLTGTQFARGMKVHLAQQITGDLAIIEIFAGDAALELSAFVQGDRSSLITGNTIDRKIFLERACFQFSVRIKGNFRTGTADRLVNSLACPGISHEYDAQHKYDVLHSNLLG